MATKLYLEKMEELLAAASVGVLYWESANGDIMVCNRHAESFLRYYMASMGDRFFVLVED